jgi:tetratricopeptide (TPR) repeat protein
MPRRSTTQFRYYVSALLRTFLAASLVLITSPPVHSKEAPLTAIQLFDGPDGAAYVQIGDFLLNGKAEVRSCAGVAEINKSNYGKLQKIPLNPSILSLERDAQGVMTVSRQSGSECVVPSNLKFEKDESLSPAKVADRALPQGQALSSSPAGTTTIPPFKPGVKIVFVAAPDTEMAEYLRGDRAQSIAQWKDYLGRYPKAAHSEAAKRSLVELLVKDGEQQIAAYKSSASTNSPSYTALQAAFARAGAAHDVLPASDSVAKLQQQVHDQLTTLTAKAHSELDAYKQALAGHTAGYAHLGNSSELTTHVLQVDSHFDPASALRSQVDAETSRVESTLKNAQSMIAAQRYDDAVAAVSGFRSFASEEPRILGVIDEAYKHHLDQGKVDAADQKWREAVQEYQKAVDIKPTPEAQAALKQAQSEFQSSTNRAAADTALQQSSAYEQDKHYLEAYEVLADLPDAQRALVKDQMQTLEPNYVKAASDEAKKLHDAHIPIQGRMDEIGVQKAHDYLQRACNLEPDNQDLKLRLDVISQTLSDYYVAQAKKYLDKPLGSGVGLAWIYLDEAQQYQSNRDDIRDERTKYAAAHNIRSTLSIKVSFRDQTSRRDSAGFADQLSDAIATGLETTSLPVRVIRAADPIPVDPNFQLIGDVLQHRPISNIKLDSVDSEYRAAEREVPNEDWNKANRDYEAANLDLQKAQKELEGAQAHGKKKDIATAESAVADAQKKVEDLHTKMDSIPRTTLTDVVKPYSYTRRTIDLSAIVELGFRIVDSNGSTIATTPSVKNTNQKEFVLLENVKPEDTKNVKEAGSPPDETQFLNDVEIAVRNDLIKVVKEKVESLPATILTRARKQVMDGDADGAADSFILYLNSTPDTATPERDEARKFLRDQYNIVWPAAAGQA